MSGLIFGIFGFLFFLLFDFMMIHKKTKIMYLFLVLGLGLFLHSTFVLINSSWSMSIPLGLRIISLGLSLLFFILVIYSVFIEVGIFALRKQSSKLVTSGTYALVRHPGVLWLFLAYLFLSLYFERPWLLIASFIWTIVNALYVFTQEHWILPKLFHDYEIYKQKTPMLIPNKGSLKRFLTSRNGGENENVTRHVTR